jgi:hypothetical protein
VRGHTVKVGAGAEETGGRVSARLEGPCLSGGEPRDGGSPGLPISLVPTPTYSPETPRTEILAVQGRDGLALRQTVPQRRRARNRVRERQIPECGCNPYPIPER